MDRTREANDAARLHSRLRDFYNTDVGYFVEAREANREVTPERALLYSMVSAGDRVLDVGCGTCENGLHLASRAEYVGCDISFNALALAAEELPAGHHRLVQGESQTLPFATGAFDVVLSTYALEHFVFPRETLDEMWRVCRPGGKVMLVAPAYDDPRILPPSASHWPAHRRGLLVLQQAWRQLVRHADPSRFYFARVRSPRILGDAYQSDFDAVHLVSAREIGNYFRAQGGAILIERRRERRPVHTPGASPLRRLREALRDAALRLHWGEYSGLNLQIVVEKPA